MYVMVHSYYKVVHPRYMISSRFPFVYTQSLSAMALKTYSDILNMEG